jgi:hypothetical protein
LQKSIQLLWIGQPVKRFIRLASEIVAIQGAELPPEKWVEMRRWFQK